MLLEEIMVILTVEQIEHEAQRQLEQWRRRLELVEVYRDHLITENELLDALLLLSLRAPNPSPEIGRGE
jgi:hypothetical protein